jgi:hypothetical protein
VAGYCQGVGCGVLIEGRRPHAKWCSDACRERTKRRARAATSAIGRPPKVELYRIDPVTGCWEWQLGKMGSGYGAISRGGKTRSAHLWLYEKLVGPVPMGHELHHVCENVGCVNVLSAEHIRPVTRAEHARLHAGRDRRGKLTAEVVLGMRGGSLTIRQAMERCKVGYQAAWEAKVGRSWRDLEVSHR